MQFVILLLISFFVAASRRGFIVDANHTGYWQQLQGKMSADGSKRPAFGGTAETDLLDGNCVGVSAISR